IADGLPRAELSGRWAGSYIECLCCALVGFHPNVQRTLLTHNVAYTSIVNFHYVVLHVTDHTWHQPVSDQISEVKEKLVVVLKLVTIYTDNRAVVGHPNHQLTTVGVAKGCYRLHDGQFNIRIKAIRLNIPPQ